MATLNKLTSISSATGRQTVGVSLADEARRLQPWCSLCGTRHDLVTHHVIPVADGGPDALPNIDVLCAHHHRLVNTDPAWDQHLRNRYFARQTACMVHLFDGVL